MDVYISFGITYAGPATEPRVTLIPTINRPMQNIASWTAAPWIVAPMIATNAVTAMPHFLPQRSGIVPLKGMATMQPTKTIETLREVVAVVRRK